MNREKREQLINYLKYNREINSDFVFTDEDVDMILEALSAEPCEDAVSREAVLTEINRMGSNAFSDYSEYSALFGFVDKLPSVKVEPQKDKTFDDLPPIGGFHS